MFGIGLGLARRSVGILPQFSIVAPGLRAGKCMPRTLMRSVVITGANRDSVRVAVTVAHFTGWKSRRRHCLGNGARHPEASVT